MDGGQRDCFRLGCPSLQTSPGSDCFLPRTLSPRLSGRAKERLLLCQASQMPEGDGGLPEVWPTGKDLF